MPSPIVECIANYSEARRPEVIEAVSQAILSLPGVYLLDRHSDLDHNRTVFTFAGDPPAVEEAAFRSIAKAAELINLDEHRGEHPRIGATDVVPFVPISGLSMQDCVQIAHRLGKRVGEELGIPVYLYEQAAVVPGRQNLEDIRRGQYEGLKEEVLTNPGRRPDFGPARLGPAGATVIGARHPLIAYNVYLTTTDVEVAKKVAKAVRNSSGGMRYVKALGLLVDGRAQVTMNLTNYKGSPLARVVELVRREAARYGVGVHHSELVGLIPEDALVDAAVWHLQLDQFEPEQVLERRLRATLQEPAPADRAANRAADHAAGFLEALASEQVAPGGGSAAAYTGAEAAALVAMVARLTAGRKKYVAVDAEMRAILEHADALRHRLADAVEQDAAAFQGVMAAFRLPKETPEQEQERAQTIESATLNAARVPLQVAHALVEVLDMAVPVVESGNLNAITDGGTGAELAYAALQGASMNIRVNLSGYVAHPEAVEMLAELRALLDQASTQIARIRAIVAQRGDLAPV